MKDSQQMNERLEEYDKYIKVNNERFSTHSSILSKSS